MNTIQNKLAHAQHVAQQKLQQTQQRLGDIDVHRLRSQAQHAASSLRSGAHAMASDLMDKVAHKEVVTIEGHGPLVLVKQLAEGGFGYVYVAKHSQSGEIFAVKRMLVQSREQQALAAGEAQLMRALQHPNIVRLLASSHGPRSGGGQGGEFLLLMEFAERGTLARWVTPNNEGEMPPPIAEERLLTCFHDTCKAVAYLHSRTPALIHYDLKLENVLEMERGTCKLADFGSASTRTFDASAASRRERLDEEDRLSRFSTMMNRSPEMMDLERGVVGTPSDVWALGCMLFTLAFQRHPFDAGGGQGVTALAVLNARWSLPTPSRYSAAATSLITAALQTDATKRPSAADLIPLVTKSVADSSAADLAAVPRRPAPNGAPRSTRAQGGGGAPASGASSLDPGWADLKAPSSAPPSAGTALVGDLLGGDPVITPAEQGGWASLEATPSFQPTFNNSFEASFDAAPPPVSFATSFDATPPPVSFETSFDSTPPPPVSFQTSFDSAPPPVSFATSFDATPPPVSFANSFDSAPTSTTPAAPAMQAPNPTVSPSADLFGAVDLLGAVDLGSAAPAAPPPRAADSMGFDFGLDTFGGGAAPPPTQPVAAASADPFIDLSASGSPPQRSSGAADDLMALFGAAPATPPAQPHTSPHPTPPVHSPPVAQLDPMADLFGGGALFGAAATPPAAAAFAPSTPSASPSPSARSGAQLSPGATAIISGVQAKPELNGKTASVLSFDPSKGRWNVQISSPFTMLSLKPENLTAQ